MSESNTADNARFTKSLILISIESTLSPFYVTSIIQTCLSHAVSSKIQPCKSIDLFI